MSNFRAFVERTVHPQLQRIPRFRSPVPLYAALVALSSVPIIRYASSASSSLPATLCKALTNSGTSDSVLLLKSLFDIFIRALNTACLQARIYVKVPIQWRDMFTFSLQIGRPRNDDAYATSRAEARYWRVSGRYRHRLYSGNGVTSASSTISGRSRDSADIPLVPYYTPRLLPLYRDRGGGKRASRETDMDVREGRISPRTFCKWHRMVFQDSCHPTLAQAAMQMKYYSNRDLREIHRIARLLPDEQVFGSKGKETRKAKGTTKFREMWQSWLENKGMDLVIVFE